MSFTRRSLLQAVAVPFVAGPAAPRGRRRRLVVPRVNGGINVHPIRRLDSVSDFTPPLIVPELVLAQMRAVYELGYRSMRTTLSFNEFGPDFFAAIPYVRLARALGVDVLGIIDQFGLGFDLIRALMDPRRRSRVLAAYLDVFAASVEPLPGVPRAGALALQVLNEPGESRALSAEQYVRLLLAPARADLQRLAPGLTVVAAAPASHRAGLLRLRHLLAAGVERACDVVAIHAYDEALIDIFAPWLRGRVWATETGVRGPALQLQWQQRVVPRLRTAVPGLEEVFWYDLLDGDEGGFRLLAWGENEAGGPVTRVVSTQLEAWLRGEVLVATGGAPLVDFAKLVPDLQPYMPTAADFAAVERAR